MVIFHSYVSLPEGKHQHLWAASVAIAIRIQKKIHRFQGPAWMMIAEDQPPHSTSNRSIIINHIYIYAIYIYIYAIYIYKCTRYIIGIF